MNRSESINELAMALSKLQGEINDVSKAKQGYGYKYADLPSVLDECRPLLCKHGLAISQLPVASGLDESVVLETILMHNSGQWISSVISMVVERGKGMSLAQAVGSVITYARRYALTAMLGISQADDDAAVKEPVPISLQRAAHNEANKLIKEGKITTTDVKEGLSLFGVDLPSKLSDADCDAFIEYLYLPSLKKSGEKNV